VRAALWLKLGYSAVILIPITFYLLTITFLGKQTERVEHIVLMCSVGIAVLFVVLLWNGSMFMDGVRRYVWGYYPRAGIAHPLFLCFYSFLSVRLLFLLYKAHAKQRIMEEAQARINRTRYFLLAFIITLPGAIDFVATDHAPYEAKSEKDGKDIWTAFPGIPGTETMVPVVISEGYNKGRLSLSKLVEVLSTNAAKHYGLYPKKGAMHIGSDADFTIVDLDRKWTIKQEKQVTLAKYNPLHNMQLKGKPVMTVVRGTVVYDETQEGVLPTKEDYSVIFNTPDENQSAEYNRSYRKDHPEELIEEIKGIKGIMVEPGFGTFTKRQSIQVLDRKIKF